MGIVAQHIGKTIGDPPNRILKDISLEIRDGEFVSLTGRSGSGKSTLLYLLSGLDSVSEGRVEISGNDLGKMESEELYHFRNQQMGFVFQFHYLIAELTAIENVLMPARKSRRQDERLSFAHGLLEDFGLKDKMNRRPRQLSGGEQQRVAIARALVMEPRYLFADEPTGSLDLSSGQTVMQILMQANRKKTMTLVVVTHEPDFAQMADRQILLADGALAKRRS
ncbi:MAG: ABC transporter ATP-binding protein [Spirochaetia bacterium]|nr:ABC transporter ATP-binding protein [Spirochaetia bacterium]